MRSRRSRKLSHTQTSVPFGTLNKFAYNFLFVSQHKEIDLTHGMFLINNKKCNYIHLYKELSFNFQQFIYFNPYPCTCIILYLHMLVINRHNFMPYMFQQYRTAIYVNLHFIREVIWSNINTGTFVNYCPQSIALLELSIDVFIWLFLSPTSH